MERTPEERVAGADYARLRTLSLMYYASFIFYMAYYVVYLTTEVGVNKGVMGTVAAVASLVSFAAHIVWGRVADRVGSPKKVLMTLYLVTAVLVTLFSFLREPVLLLAIVLLIAFFSPPIQSMTDSWSVQFIAARPRFHYGAIRAFGSIGTTLAALAAFLLFCFVPGMSYTWLFRMFPLFPLVGLLTVWRMDFQPKAREKVKYLEAVPVLLKNRDFMVLLLSLTLVLTGFFMVSVFQANRINELGGTQAQMGFTWVFSTGSEVPILLLAGRLKRRFKTSQLLCFSFCMFIVRLTLMSLANSVGLIYAANALNGVTYGIFTPIFLTYVNRAAPEGFKNSAMGLSTAIYYNGGNFIAGLLAGWISAAFSIVTACWTAVCVTATGLVLFVIYRYVLHRGQYDDELGSKAA